MRYRSAQRAERSSPCRRSGGSGISAGPTPRWRRTEAVVALGVGREVLVDDGQRLDALLREPVAPRLVLFVELLGEVGDGAAVVDGLALHRSPHRRARRASAPRATGRPPGRPCRRASRGRSAGRAAASRRSSASGGRPSRSARSSRCVHISFAANTPLGVVPSSSACGIGSRGVRRARVGRRQQLERARRRRRPRSTLAAGVGARIATAARRTPAAGRRHRCPPAARTAACCRCEAWRRRGVL